MSTQKRIQNYKKGQWAENFAKLYFLSKGYKVIKTRYKTRMGEIDLILEKKNMIILLK